jgi:hypothetical protein
LWDSAGNKKERQMRTVIIMVVGFVMMFEVAIAAPKIGDADLRQAVEELSASTLVGGEGWTAYDRFLHPDKSLEEWWNYGMRVARRDIEMIAVDMVGDIAIIRYKTTEEFVGPDGPVEGFSGYVTNVWIMENSNWLLLSAEISSIARTD